MGRDRKGLKVIVRFIYEMLVMEQMSKDKKRKYKISFIKQFGKKAWDERNRKRRETNGFNTGTRDMKSKKDYSRAEEKKLCRQFLQKSK